MLSYFIVFQLGRSHELATIGSMNKWLQKNKESYAAFQERMLATFPPDQRNDVRVFGAKWHRHKRLYIAACGGVWVIAALLMRLANDRIGWIEAFFLTFLILGCSGFATLSAWFGHGKFKLTVKWAVIMVLITVAGALVGGLIGAFIKGDAGGLADIFVRIGPKIIFGGLIAGIIYSALMAGIIQMRHRQLQLRNLVLEQQAIEVCLARQLADARLKLVQAQVEPHFLFNTLASVQHLAEGRAPEAAQLTGELIVFLRAGLAGLRNDTTTLQSEFEMATALLAIMKIRMGTRLTYSLDLPIAIEEMRVPPAMLISLVENAVKHGVEPAPEGGSIHIFARLARGKLCFGVTDTGMGLVATTKTDRGDGGVGLANIRERLSAIFGDGGTLEVEEIQPHGVTATISIEAPDKPGVDAEAAADRRSEI